MNSSRYNNGMVVRSFTVCCGCCSKEETFSDQTVIEGRRHIYRQTAEMAFRNFCGWTTRKKVWLCPSCAEYYDQGDPQTLKIIEENMREIAITVDAVD